MSASFNLLPLWIFLTFSSHCAFDDEEEVFCDFMASCVLPCSFQTGPNVVVNWERPGVAYISHYSNGKARGAKNSIKQYRGRTSLFVEEIPKGNASMLLREVRGQDAGSYVCLASTSTHRLRETSIRLRVRVPVVNVSLELRGEELLCRSQDIYPRPNVTWSFSPERPDKPRTTVSPTETGLFSVLSSVPLSPSSPHEYICNISTEHSWRSATYRRNPEISFSNSVTVSCADPAAPVKTLLWRFNGKEMIFNKTGSALLFGPFYSQFVDGLTNSNGLVLVNLTPDQQGLYSCELSTEYETYLTLTEVTAKPVTQDSWLTPTAVVVVIIMFLVIVLLVVRSCLKNKKRKSSRAEAEDPRSSESVEVSQPEALETSSCTDSLMSAFCCRSGSCDDSSGIELGQSRNRLLNYRM